MIASDKFMIGQRVRFVGRYSRFDKGGMHGTVTRFRTRGQLSSGLELWREFVFVHRDGTAMPKEWHMSNWERLYGD